LGQWPQQRGAELYSNRKGEAKTWGNSHQSKVQSWGNGRKSEQQNWKSGSESWAWSCDSGCGIAAQGCGTGCQGEARFQGKGHESDAQSWRSGRKSEAQSWQSGQKKAQGDSEAWGNKGANTDKGPKKQGPTRKRGSRSKAILQMCPLDPACTAKDFKERSQACCKVEEALSHDDTKTQTFFWWMLPSAQQFAMWKGGTRVVQRLLEVLPSNERQLLVAELSFSELYDDLWGNHVLTKVMDEMPLDALGPVMELVEEKGSVAVAKHKYGCRVLDKLITQAPDMTSSDMKSLIDPLVDAAAELAKHQYGNFVIKQIFEHDERGHYRGRLVQQLLPLVSELASLKVGSHLTQELLQRSQAEEQQAIAAKILSAESPHSLEELAADKRGSFVVGDLLALHVGNVAAVVSSRLASAPKAEAAYWAHVADRAAKEMEPKP